MTPRTWVAGEKLTAAKMNEIRDDLNSLIASVAYVAPTGVVLPYSGSSAPTNWLLCDGSAVSRTTYATLFALIGTTFGVGDGSTTFNVPDLRGRVPVGVGTGSGLTLRTLAATGGEETHVLTATEMPAHTHTYNNYSNVQNTAGGAQSAAYSVPNSGTTGSAGSNAAHNNMQPFVALNYIIKT